MGKQTSVSISDYGVPDITDADAAAAHPTMTSETKIETIFCCHHIEPSAVRHCTIAGPKLLFFFCVASLAVFLLNQDTMSAVDDAFLAQAAEFRRLRTIEGHWDGQVWNADVDAFNGAIN